MISDIGPALKLILIARAVSLHNSQQIDLFHNFLLYSSRTVVRNCTFIHDSGLVFHDLIVCDILMPGSQGNILVVAQFSYCSSASKSTVCFGMQLTVAYILMLWREKHISHHLSPVTCTTQLKYRLQFVKSMETMSMPTLLIIIIWSMESLEHKTPDNDSFNCLNLTS